jgi:hypothetical protein
MDKRENTDERKNDGKSQKEISKKLVQSSVEGRTEISKKLKFVLVGVCAYLPYLLCLIRAMIK